MALPHGTVDWSAVRDYSFPDHTRLSFDLKSTVLVSGSRIKLRSNQYGEDLITCESIIY